MYKDLDFTIEKANREFEKLKFMARTDDGLVYNQITEVDRLITRMRCKFNYIPDWQSDYERICKDSYEPIKTVYISASEISFPFSYN